MATLRHNISGATTVALLSPGDNYSGIKCISIANTHASDDTFVDLHIGTISAEGTAAVSYYLLKNRLLQKGGTMILDSDNIKFDNTLPGVGSTTGLGLFITLSASTSTVDVIII